MCLDIKRECPIFCLEKSIDFPEFSSEFIQWAFINKDSETVLLLTESQVYEYQKQGLWYLISSIIQNYLFGAYEEDYIFDFNMMSDIITVLEKSKFIHDENVQKIIFILTYAIQHKNVLPFLFNSKQ